MGCTARDEKASEIADKSPAKKRTEIQIPAVDAVFDAYPKPVKAKLLALRRLIFDTAKATKGVGAWRKP